MVLFTSLQQLNCFHIYRRTTLRKFTRNSLIVIIATLIIGFAQYSSGFLIEKYYKKFFSNSSKELKFNIELKSFKRNIFTSNASIEISFPTNDTSAKIYVIPIQQKIIHGPLVLDWQNRKFPINIALAHIHYELGEQFKAQLLELFHNDKPFTVMTKLGFFANGTTYFTGIPIKQTTESKFEVIWDGFSGKIQHSSDLRSLQGKITAPRLTLKDTDIKLNISNINFNFTSKEHNKLSIGDSNIHIGKLMYFEQKKPLMKVINLDINSSLDNDKKAQDKIRYSLTVNTENSQVLKQKFSKNSYQLAAQSLTTEFFTVLHANYDKKFALLDDLLRQLLNSEAKLEISMPKYFSQSLISFVNFQLYRNSILGKIDPRSKEQVLSEISNNITAKCDSLVTNKVFVEEQDTQQYKIHIQFNKTGKIMLNGEQLQNPLQALRGLEQAQQNSERSCPVIQPKDGDNGNTSDTTNSDITSNANSIKSNAIKPDTEVNK